MAITVNEIKRIAKEAHEAAKDNNTQAWAVPGCECCEHSGDARCWYRCETGRKAAELIAEASRLTERAERKGA